MSRKLFIGDIHGCLQTFEALLDQMNFDLQDELYLLGDYIDRGMNSKGVMDAIFRYKKEGYKLITLRGNHEQMLIRDYGGALKNTKYKSFDEEFLYSFGIKDLTQLPIEYLQFCTELPYYYQEEDFILAHAGLNFDYLNPLAQSQELIWVRNWYGNINYNWLGKKVIVHGHTPQAKFEIEDQFKVLEATQVLCIDSGVFMSRKKEKGMGFLCGLDWTNRKLYFQENIELENRY